MLGPGWPVIMNDWCQMSDEIRVGQCDIEHSMDPNQPHSCCEYIAKRLKASEAHAEALMQALKGKRESFERTRPICSGCVDKQSGRGCIACERDRAERKLAVAEQERELQRERADRQKSLREKCEEVSYAAHSDVKILRELLSNMPCYFQWQAHREGKCRSSCIEYSKQNYSE